MNSMLTVILRKLFNLLLVPLSILKAIWRRAVCRSGRGRKNSGHILPITISKPLINDSVYIPNNEPELQPWEAWDASSHGDGQIKETEWNDSASLSTKDSRQYSNRQKLSQQERPQEEDLDYFQDMVPRVIRNTKIILHKNDESYNTQGKSKFAVSNDVPIPDNELGAWDERMTESAWADEAVEDLSWQASNEIKEKKRLEREMRYQDQLKKKEERSSVKPARAGVNLTAVRLS